jgi:tetratricopeptide (TPR) repeat protein
VVLRGVGERWVAMDQGSGNGTLINDVEVDGQIPLQNGDRITLGDTELTFMDNEEGDGATRVDISPDQVGRPQAIVRRTEEPRLAVRPRPTRAARRKVSSDFGQRRKRFLSLLAVLAVGMLVAGLFRQSQERKRAKVEIAESAKRVEIDKVMLVFQEGKNLVRKGDWKNAQGKFLQVQKLTPGHPGLKEYLDRAPREVQNQEQLALAELALADNKLASAFEALEKITADTTLDEQVQGLKASIEEKAETHVRSAREALAARDAKAVVAMTEDVLAVYPDHRDARVLNEQAKRALKSRERKTPNSAGQARPWQPGVERFRDGDIDGAISMLEECIVPRCGPLLGKIRAFQELYGRGDSLSEKELVKLLSLDDDITDGRPSKMARTVGTRASTTFYKSATAARAAEQWGRAVEMAKRALRADPEHAGAAALVVELRARAKEVYLQGYTLKETSPEEAILKFREVLQMTTPDDDSYQKSKKWLETLTR